jgi:predicted O-methyltransferase YrrM
MNIKQLAKTIELVTGEQYLKIIEYINEPSKDKELQNEILNSINNSSEKSVTDKTTKFAKRLGWYAIVRIKKPKVVVETGVDKGLGSILLSSAIRKNTDEGYSGRYYGTDINPRAGFMLSGIYKKYGEILYGDSIQSLTKFNDKIDIFINDSDHSEEYEYDEYITVKNKLNDDAIILGDNSHCTDKLLEFSNYTNRKFIFWCEKPVDHWYAGGGIGFSFNNFSK